MICTVDTDAERPRLRALAYRMLGTVADAEDVVQESFARFYQLPPDQRQLIRNPGAWLMRVASRLALDQLKSARAHREHYVGPWLPEPVPRSSDYAAGAAQDPLDAVIAAEDVSQALLVLLEQLSPAERAVYVLRESFGLPYAEIAVVLQRSAGACRQLFSVAAKRLRGSGTVTEANTAEHDDAVRAFAAACESGDLASLAQVLDPSVILRSDGGGRVSAAQRPVLGLDHVSRLLLGLRSKYPQAAVELVEVPGTLGAALLLNGEVGGLMTCAVGPRGISDVWIMRNPDKLTLWQPSGQ